MSVLSYFEGVGWVKASLLWCDHCTLKISNQDGAFILVESLKFLILYILSWFETTTSWSWARASLRPLLETVVSIFECWCNDWRDLWSRFILNLLGLLQAQPRSLLSAFEWYIARELHVIASPGLCSFLKPWLNWFVINFKLMSILTPSLVTKFMNRSPTLQT